MYPKNMIYILIISFLISCLYQTYTYPKTMCTCYQVKLHDFEVRYFLSTKHIAFPTACLPQFTSPLHIWLHTPLPLLSLCKHLCPPFSTFNVIMCMALSPHILHIGTYSSNLISFPTPIVLHVLHMPSPTPINPILGHGQILQHMGPPLQVPLATTMKAKVNQHPCWCFHLF